MVRPEDGLREDVLHLAGADRPVEGAEADGDPAALARLVELALGVDQPAVGRRREAHEVEPAAAGQADAVDLQQVDELADRTDRIGLAAMADVVRPVVLGQGAGSYSSASIGIDPERRDLLDRERTGRPGSCARSTSGWSNSVSVSGGSPRVRSWSWTCGTVL